MNGVPPTASGNGFVFDRRASACPEGLAAILPDGETAPERCRFATGSR